MKCPTNSEIFTFPTLEDRKEFLTELSLRFPDARYATALDPGGRPVARRHPGGSVRHAGSGRHAHLARRSDQH